MNYGKVFLVVLLVGIAGPGGLYALSEDLTETSGFTAIAAYAQAVPPASPEEIPASVRNNKYYAESARLTKLAQDSYGEGDYDSSTDYAEEALRYARLSDEYVALQLKISETDRAIAAARNRLDWAVSVRAPTRYPNEYGQANTEYGNARNSRGAEKWDEAIAAANRALLALAGVDSPGSTAPVPPPPAPAPVPGRIVLPAQYTVRPWNLSKDCLWNIAGRSWAYGDPEKWRILYDANKAKLASPDNPNLIEPGLVLDIPSIQGEERQGMWEANREYPSLR